MKNLAFFVALVTSGCLLVNPSNDAVDDAIVQLESVDSLRALLSTKYSNVFLLVCPEVSLLDEPFNGCNQFMQRVVDVVRFLSLDSVVNLRFGVAATSTTSNIAVKHRLEKSPTVLYARKNHAGDTFIAKFVGEMEDQDMDDTFITMWARDNSHSYLRSLSEENFEHLTQASSGATTGDWLVAFVDEGFQEDLASQLALDTIAAEYKHQLSVALVDINSSPKLAKRFKVSPLSSASLTLRYFRLEKMYFYEFDRMNFQTLKAFVTGGYRNVRVEKVPGEPTPFDQLVENVVVRLKDLGYPNFIGTFILILAFTAAMSILIVLACCASKEGKDLDTKFKKG